MKRLAIIESPFAGNVEKNLKYLRACMRDCLLKGDSPFASHGLYTQKGVLNDDDQVERLMGISAGFEWRRVANVTLVYTDLGTSSGMELGIAHAKQIGCPVEYRMLGESWEKA